MTASPVPARGFGAALRLYALGLPEAHEDFPWGHNALKIRRKTFLFLSAQDGEVRMSCKLPHSSSFALTLPGAQPTPYGLGKSGWVTLRLMRGREPPRDLLESWILESYRAIAPKKLAAAAGAVPAAARPAGTGRRAGSRR